MAEPGSINNSGSFLNPLYSSGSQESLSDSVNASETGISPGGRRTRAKTQGHPASQALAERVRSGSYVPGAESPPLRRHRVTSPTTRTPASPNSDLHTSRLASATTAVAPVQVTISVATIRESFGGLIERTAGGAQTVSAGYDSTIRAHFDNIREHVASNSFHGDKAAVTEYLDYLESLLPPRSHDDKQPSLDKLPNGKTVSADNQARWRSDFAKPVASLKTEWAIIAGQIGSLQNASNKQEAIDKIKGQLAHIELRLSAFNQSEDSAEIAQAIQDLSAYQQYLYSELDKKVTAIDAWEKAVGNEVVAAFKIANDAIVSLPGKPEERREALEQIRLSLAALPVAQQEPKTHKFLQAQLRFFEREATVIDVWKASDGHTDRTRTKSNFLQARVFLRQNTYAYADRIDARNQHILAIVEKFPALDPAERHRASNEIRSLLALNESDYDSALASIPDSTGLKKKHVRRVFGDFYNQQAQLSKAAKQAATAPIAPPDSQPKLR